MNIRTLFFALTLGLIATVPAHAGGSVNFAPNCPPTNAVPEPATLSLALLGLLPLARRRKS